MRKLFTSESVTEGHPDKMCDQISDAVLDALLEQDPYSRVACETCTTTGLILVMGEITTRGYVPIADIARQVVNEIGYDRAKKGFDGASCAVLTAVHDQSPDIAQGVDTSDDHEQGAGDQGMMFGFACDETPELMPMPIALAHRLTRRMATIRKDGTLPWMRPDGKAQVTVAYEDGKPVAVDAVVISTQHDETVTQEEIRRAMIDLVIRHEIPAELLHAGTQYYINPTGRFVIGGSFADTGVTGRKIMCDTYGGAARHGGGAFSGKDPTKVDRSAAYIARKIAKDIIKHGYAKRAEVQLAYAIGIQEPVSVSVECFGTQRLPKAYIVSWIRKHYDLTPDGIISFLGLRDVNYNIVSTYGHFWHPWMPWEE